MQDLLSLAEFLQNYANAIGAGFEKFVQSTPVFTRQFMERQTRKKLTSTRDAYMEAVKVKLAQNVLVVELDKDNWIANAVESGVSSFDMKDKHLKSPKAKISKAGYRYMVIPIGKQKDGTGGKTQKSQDFQAKVNQALANNKFGLKRLKAMVGGKIMETQEVLSDDVGLGGFYRFRTFETAEAYHSGSRPQWQHVLFRVMSENPASKSTWEHPGIEPVHIMRDTENFLMQNMSAMLDGFLETEIEKMVKKMNETVGR